MDKKRYQPKLLLVKLCRKNNTFLSKFITLNVSLNTVLAILIFAYVATIKPLRYLEQESHNTLPVNFISNKIKRTLSTNVNNLKSIQPSINIPTKVNALESTWLNTRAAHTTNVIFFMTFNMGHQQSRVFKLIDALLRYLRSLMYPN